MRIAWKRCPSRQTVLVDSRNPGAALDLKDPGANVLAQIQADAEADVRFLCPVQQLVAGTGATDAPQHLDRLDLLAGDLRKRDLRDGDLVGGAVCARVARTQHGGERFAGLIAVGEHRMKPVAALVVPGRPVLLRMRRQQGCVQIDRGLLRRAG